MAGWSVRIPDGRVGAFEVRPRAWAPFADPVVAGRNWKRELPSPPAHAGGPQDRSASPPRARPFPSRAKWTDGSVQGGLCGAAFVQEGMDGWEAFEFSLEDDLTIDVCEAYAL